MKIKINEKIIDEKQLQEFKNLIEHENQLNGWVHEHQIDDIMNFEVDEPDVRLMAEKLGYTVEVNEYSDGVEYKLYNYTDYKIITEKEALQEGDVVYYSIYNSYFPNHTHEDDAIGIVEEGNRIKWLVDNHGILDYEDYNSIDECLNYVIKISEKTSEINEQMLEKYINLNIKMN